MYHASTLVQFKYKPWEDKIAGELIVMVVVDYLCGECYADPP